MTLQHVALGVAIGEAEWKVREEGANRGARVSQYLRTVDPPIAIPAPWCAAFVQFVADRAADHLLMPNPLDAVRQEALVASYWGWANESGRLIDPSKAGPGDLVLFNFRRKGWDHIGMLVRRVSSLTLVTVEGNTSPGVGADRIERERDGEGVFVKHRSTDRQPIAVIRWADAA
jgi:hypothetical protein